MIDFLLKASEIVAAKYQESVKYDCMFQGYNNPMCLFGLWPLWNGKLLSWKLLFTQTVIQFLFATLVLFFACSILANIFINLRNMDSLAPSVSYFTILVYCLIRYCYLIYNVRRVGEIMAFINSSFRRQSYDFRTPKQQLIAKNDAAVVSIDAWVKTSNRFSSIFTKLGSVAVALFLCKPFLNKTLMFDGWLPFDTTTTKNFVIVNIVQGLITFQGGASLIVFNCFMFHLLCLICAQFDVLQASITSLNYLIYDEEVKFAPTGFVLRNDRNAVIISGYNLTNNHELLLGFKKCVRHHQRIMRLIAELRIFYQPILMIESIAVVLIVAFSIGDIAKLSGIKHKLHALLLAVIVLLHLAIFCWLGNEVTTKEMSVRHGLIQLRWFRLRKSMQKNISIMMYRADREINIDGGPFYILNITTLISTLKLVVSTVLVLVKFKSDYHDP